MSTAGFPVTDGVVTLLPPPEGYVVDFDNPQQQQVLQHYLVFGIAGPLAFIALCQRFYTKAFLLRGLQVDDLFMFLGWAASIVTQAMLTHSIAQGGMCAHAWEMSLDKFKAYSTTTYITAPVFMLCNGFTKLSLLTFYLHLSPMRWFRVSVWSSIVLVALYTAVITFMMFFQCSPIDKAFDPTVTTGTCLNAGILYMATAVSNIITDLILFVLPLPMVYGLHMPVAQKVGAVIVFGIGSVTIGTSVVRLALLPPVLKSTDPSWDAAPANVWTFVEGNLFVICGSMPTLRKFFKHFAPRIMGSSITNSYGNSYGHGQSTTAMSRSRKPRRQYSQFPDENELDTFRGDSPPGRNKDLATTSVTADATADGDAHSEKAILQTKSFTVQYE